MKTPPFALVLVLGATGGAIEALGFGGGDGGPPARGRMALVSVTLGLEDLASSYLVAGGYVRDASDLRLLPRPPPPAQSGSEGGRLEPKRLRTRNGMALHGMTCQGIADEVQRKTYPANPQRLTRKSITTAQQRRHRN